VADAGGDQASFHIEVMASVQDAAQLAAKIRALGMRAGVALAPQTGIEQVSELVAGGHVDLVLCMTVTPGFGGQKFQPQVMDKVGGGRIEGGIVGGWRCGCVDLGCAVPA
jgi:ribulose-phosphate 3-epimerase